MKRIVCTALFLGVMGFNTSAHASGLALSAFAGAKSVHSSTHFAVGADLEIPVGPSLGFNTFAERANNETSLGAGLAFHPLPLTGLKLLAAPGVELVGGSNHFLFRAGATYEITIAPGIHAGPTFNLDFVNSTTAQVYGLVVGMGL